MNRPSWHVLGLWSLTVVQPLLDLLAGSPEFFAAHRAGAFDVLLLVATLLLVLPLPLLAGMWLARRLGPWVAAIVLTLVVGALAAMLVIQTLNSIGVSDSSIAVPVSLVSGAALAFAYGRFAGVQTFATVLSIAVVLVPVVFVVRPAIRGMIVPAGTRAARMSAATVPLARPVPVVMIVFDELPLLSLLDVNGNIEEAHYPNFAALASDGVWYRNATTVSDYTRWALPAILDGRYPRANAVPTRSYYFETLFTFLARTHRLEVDEAVTDLCPPELCRAATDPRLTRVRRMLTDLGLVYLHVLAPPDLRSQLPDVSGAWAGFGAQSPDDDTTSPDAWRMRWRQARTRDKNEIAVAFIDGISAGDPQPTFYFMHSLLSHHPHVFLPTGQKNSTRGQVPWPKASAGIDDPWALVQQQQRQLLHTAHIDRLVGRLVTRLKREGLYDRTLILLTSDHGVAFRAGGPLRTFSEETASDIMRVPLIIKFPADPVPAASGEPSLQARVSDQNVETVDIIPTIADALGTRVPWRTDGRSLLDRSVPERALKQIFCRKGWPKRYGRAGPPLRVLLREKSAVFNGADNRWRVPRPTRYAELVGKPVRDLLVSAGGDLAEVRHFWRYAFYDPGADAVPFDVSGRLAPRARGQTPTHLAIAVNGVIGAVTETWKTRPSGWLATPPLDAWRRGRNEVEVFVVDEVKGQTVLRRVFRMMRRPAGLNLISRAAAAWGIHHRGLYHEEVRRDRMIRWTAKRAEISVPPDERRPRALRIHVARSSRPHHRFRLTASDCVLFDGRIPAPEWETTFDLGRCRLTGDTLTIVVESDVVRPARDSRQLGVALRSMVLDEGPPTKVDR